MEDNVEADENANADTVLDALRRVIEKGIVIWGDQKKRFRVFLRPIIFSESIPMSNSNRKHFVTSTMR